MIPVWWQKFRASKNGKIDGAMGFPAADQQEPSLYEQHLVSIANNHITRTCKAWIEKDKAFKKDYCESLKTEQQLKEKLDVLKVKMEDTSDKTEDLKSKEEKIHKVSILYTILMIFLAIAEFPMNSVVFDILGEVKWLTYLLAAGLGIAIPMAAHYLGINLRRQKDSQSRNTAMSVVIITIMLLTVFGIAYLREKYVMNTIEILKIDFDPRMVSIVFISMNLLIFTVATIASYMAHIDVSDEAIKMKQSTERTLVDCKKLLKEQTTDIEKLSSQRNKILNLIEKIEVVRRKTKEEFKQEALTWVNHFHWLMDIYRISNMRARKSANNMPESFKRKPAIGLGILEDDLDMDCD